MSSGLPVGSERYVPYVCDPEKAIAAFGDVNFIEYGGQLLMPGVDANDEPYLEVVQQPCDDETKYGVWLPDARWTIYRVEPEQKKIVEKNRQVYLVCVRYADDWPRPASSYDEWFHKELEAVASCIGSSMQSIRDGICSDDPIERASAYIDMAAYWGWHEFDHYPLRLTQHEVHLRYGAVDECECRDCELNREEELNRALKSEE